MRIVILATVRLLGEGLEVCLRRSDQVRVAGVAEDLRGLRALLVDPQPDLALVDLTGGIDLDEVRPLATERPGPKLVGMGVAERRAEVLPCARAGFAAYVPRDASPDRPQPPPPGPPPRPAPH